VAVEVLGLLVASAGASYTWWRLQRRRERLLAPAAFEAALAPDAAVALSVAKHEVVTRGHSWLYAEHVLYGLLQDEDFVAAITRLGGDATVIEDRVQVELADQAKFISAEPPDMTHLLGHAYHVATHEKRSVTCVDLWAYASRLPAAQLVRAGKVTEHELRFTLVHGMPEPSTDLADRTDVHVVLRNDSFTTREFVVQILREVFDLADDEAETRMMATHNEGRSVVGRYKLASARAKIDEVRTRARAKNFPLWIGVEDC
jgi:ATP-dependent Clp protease adaptor protein ClpS